MNTQFMDKVIKQLHQNYPELFDDNSTDNKLNFYITRSWTKCRQYKDKISNDELSMLVTIYTAYLIANVQSTQGDSSMVKMDIFQAQFTGGSNSADVYLSDFNELLADLGLNDSGWGVKLL